MNELSHHVICNGSFPETEHRISVIQVGVALTTFLPDGSPSRLRETTEHMDKLRKAVASALQDNWANIVVLPDVSVPADLYLKHGLAVLVAASWGIRDRSFARTL